MKRLAIIGGTGVDELEDMAIVQAHSLKTRYGEPSHPIKAGRWHGLEVFFLQRHGSSHAIPPHKINYRANLCALESLGVTDIVAINAVGGINSDMPTGALVIPDQIIDYTWGREHTFDDGDSGQLLHIDFTEPYDANLRAELLAAGTSLAIPLCAPATLGVTQGPRLETAAEICRLESDGCDLVGMTGMPEAALARELGMAYAAVCMVVNPAAGKGSELISLESMRETLANEATVVARLLTALLQSYGAV